MIKEVLLSLSFLLLRSLHALQGVAITGVLDLRELVALVVVVAAHESFSVRSNLDILLEVLKAFVRAVDADDVVDEEHAGRLVAVVSFYFRRNHAVCLVIRRMIFLWSSSQLSYYLVRLRATVVLAAGAHVRVARAPVFPWSSSSEYEQSLTLL